MIRATPTCCHCGAMHSNRYQYQGTFTVQLTILTTVSLIAIFLKNTEETGFQNTEAVTFRLWFTYPLAVAAHHQSCYCTWTAMQMECRSAWAERFVLYMAAGAASFLV